MNASPTSGHRPEQARLELALSTRLLPLEDAASLQPELDAAQLPVVVLDARDVRRSPLDLPQIWLSVVDGSAAVALGVLSNIVFAGLARVVARKVAPSTSTVELRFQTASFEASLKVEGSQEAIESGLETLLTGCRDELRSQLPGGQPAVSEGRDAPATTPDDPADRSPHEEHD